MTNKNIGVSRSAEEVVSMFLGLVIVLVVFGLVINFFQRKRGSISLPGLQDEKEEELNLGVDEAGSGQKGGVWVVKAGESLWKIAESQYNSGYKWVDIAKENDLTNPGVLAVGQELNLPQIETEEETGVAETDEIAGSEYQVERGDNLWEVAVRAYADGYQWTKLWEANRDKLNSPNLLEIGMILSVPR